MYEFEMEKKINEEGEEEDRAILAFQGTKSITIYLYVLSSVRL